MSITPSTTVTSLTNFGRKKLEKLRGNREKSASEKLMSLYQKGNQKERRKRNNTQAGLHSAFQCTPQLPLDKTTYSVHCISRTGHHDCSTSCENEIICISSHTCHLYICDYFSVLIELWKHKYNNLHDTTAYTLLWQREDLHYITRFCQLSRI